MKTKLLIISHKRWGKDTMAEFLRNEIGLKFISSSQAAADIFIYDKLKNKYGYKTSEECFEDRVNHRAEWYDLICEYNKEDKTKLAKGILELANCYVGMRDRNEIDECIKQGLFDLIVWVDASERLPEEDKDSFNIDKSCADIIIDNNGDLESFKKRVIRFGKCLK
jgi:dephospho-CoA kinase